MTPENFTYWLNGHAEALGSHAPTDVQWQNICDHLRLVLTEVPKPTRPVIPNNIGVGIAYTTGAGTGAGPGVLIC